MSEIQINIKNLSLAYGDTTIIDSLNLAIPKGKITVFIGRNGCGKSTLLQAMGRLIKPRTGSVFLDDRDILKMDSKEVAKELSILPQSPIAPEGVTVEQLVKQGRYPYQSTFKQWTQEDETTVNHALTVTNMEELQNKHVNELSGGQRQRAWIALNLTQNTDTLLLDEPTTYLDLSHQIEILDLLYEMNRKDNRTIVMVLHDINLASRYADHLVAIKDQKVFIQGVPEAIITSENIERIYGLKCRIGFDSKFGTPICYPEGKGRNIKTNNGIYELA
ncbi:ABC transporter ATP-binding protein [Paenisporosarcina antarctica]|uniref:ABC transporter ATP-binding protein n=1 Tax=Paenisporosarcina antarctica TaxID=417367 RepID=A0A4P6ZUT2_9BACL|nr:ABC transporter ATP-binding protein [Paenisporosarcina antarctica]QBP39854.1 ABC transporter ATP-binding protein [Paenisporosarcina antarctica]